HDLDGLAADRHARPVDDAVEAIVITALKHRDADIACTTIAAGGLAATATAGGRGTRCTSPSGRARAAAAGHFAGARRGLGADPRATGATAAHGIAACAVPLRAAEIITVADRHKAGAGVGEGD